MNNLSSNNIVFKYFKYLLKISLKPTIFIFIVGILTYPLVVSLTDMGEAYATCQVGFSITFIAILTYVVPVVKTAYLKKKTTIDYFYSLPIKRRTLANLNLLVGGLEILIPFTITYFLGMIITMFKTSEFHYGYYFPLYLSLVGLMIPLYIFNTFICSRANSVVDSVFFILLYTFALWPLSVILSDVFNINLVINDIDLVTCAPFVDVGNLYTKLIETGSNDYYELDIPYVLIAIELLTYIPFFILTKKDKSERSEQISDSYLGYRLLIPYYIIILIALIVLENSLSESMISLFVIAAGLIGYAIYYRKFKLPKKGWLMFGISVFMGFGLGLLFTLISRKLGGTIDDYTYMIMFSNLIK